MTTSQKVALMRHRLTILEGNGKNIKSPGVVRKLQRQIRNYVPIIISLENK